MKSRIKIERIQRILKITTEKKRESVWNATAYNGRFCEMAAVTPQTILCVIARLSPAASVVKPPPRKAAGTLEAMRGQHSVSTE